MRIRRLQPPSPEKAKTVYVHLTHNDGEEGTVDYEAILGPYENVGITHTGLMDGLGNPIARIHMMTGTWFLTGESDARRGPYTDVSFSDERPKSALDW